MQKSNSFKSQKPVIAIDGTAGSGKGTLAKKLANLIKFDHLDTGLLYRICALEMLERTVKLENLDIASWLDKHKDLSILSLLEGKITVSLAYILFINSNN